MVQKFAAKLVYFIYKVKKNYFIGKILRFE